MFQKSCLNPLIFPLKPLPLERSDRFQEIARIRCCQSNIFTHFFMKFHKFVNETRYLDVWPKTFWLMNCGSNMCNEGPLQQRNLPSMNGYWIVPLSTPLSSKDLGQAPRNEGNGIDFSEMLMFLKDHLGLLFQQAMKKEVFVVFLLAVLAWNGQTATGIWFLRKIGSKTHHCSAH